MRLGSDSELLGQVANWEQEPKGAEQVLSPSARFLAAPHCSAGIQRTPLLFCVTTSVW